MDPRYDGSDAYLDYTVTLVVQNEQTMQKGRRPRS